MNKVRLQVIVPALNKRHRLPPPQGDPEGIIGVVLEGFSFIGEEVGPEEMRNRSIGKWYKDRDGYYYWGGGLLVIDEIMAPPVAALKAVPKGVGLEGAIPFDPNKMSWGHKLYDIPFIWNDLGTMGAGVTVAVIDTGVDVTHEDLIPNIHQLSKSFVGSETDFSDTAGHGTNMAGIIGAAGRNKIYGIAPQTSLLIVRATPDGTGTDLQKFIDAVNYAAEQPDVDIISISYSFVSNNTDVERLKLIKKLGVSVQNALDKGKIVVASIGDLRTSLSPPEDRDTYPSSFNDGIPNKKGVLAVGAFDQAGKVCSFSNHNKHLFCLAPGDRAVLTTGLNNSVVNGGQTSIAAALTSGCLALLLSYSKVKLPGKKIDFNSILLDTCDDVGPATGPDSMSGFGKINIRNAVAKIKSL